MENIKEVPAIRGGLHSAEKLYMEKKQTIGQKYQKLICSTNIWVPTMSYTRNTRYINNTRYCLITHVYQSNMVSKVKEGF